MKLKFAYILLVLFFFNTDLRSQWILVQNFDTGSISDIEVHNNFLFAANGDSGVFRSPDNGENWTSVNSGFSTTYVTGLTVSNFGIFASTVSGVFSSTNNGNNWNATGSGISGGYIRKITSVDNDIYAGHILPESLKQLTTELTGRDALVKEIRCLPFTVLKVNFTSALQIQFYVPQTMG
ncbi:MAG: hypothetical protein IPG78_04405 [Ignavibacteria bacterium]|nr:hypothetical protein [Ignavibacteria bacterium]